MNANDVPTGNLMLGVVEKIKAFGRLPISWAMRRSPRAYLYLSIAAIIAITFGIFLQWPNFGANLFSEALGIMVGTLVIERLLSFEDEKRLAPARLAAFRDAMAISRDSREFILALARSSVPSSALARVSNEYGYLPTPWLAEYFALLQADSPAPYGAPPPWGTGFLNWSQGLSMEVATIKALLDKYLTRHSAHGDPGLTEVVQDLEENGLFRSLSYGDHLFWMTEAPGLRSGMYENFIEKVARLISVTHALAGKYSNGTDWYSHTRFEWDRLAIELRENETRSEKAPWRPV